MKAILPVITALVAAVLASLVLASGAQASGDVAVDTVRYVDRLEVDASFVVWDFDHCDIEDPDADFEYDACYDYANNYADLSLAVYTWKHHRWQLMYREHMEGENGEATASIDFFIDLGAPWRAKPGATYYYKLVVSLIDPFYRDVASRQSSRFNIRYPRL